MSGLSLAMLSRVQFAFTIGFHIIWPTVTIGLGLFLVVMEGLWLKTNQEYYVKLYKFWAKIYALAFAIGVVTGIPLSFQFGTNFSQLSNVGGAVLGPLLGVEVMTAFFLEAAFIGVMLFGWGRVPKYLHFLATVCVVVGTHNSSFWIMAANSWMQTPQGVALEGGRLVVTDWWQVVFNPSFIPRLLHMLLGSYLSAGLLIGGVSSWFILKNQGVKIAKLGLKIAVSVTIIVAVLQVVIGHWTGDVMYKYQPSKVAAIEGLWQTTKHAPLVLFAWPDKELQKNLYSIEIPSGSSLILTRSLDGEVKGLNEYKNIGVPSVPVVFYSFRVMVGCGVIALLLGILGCFYSYTRHTPATPKWLLWINVLSSPLGIVAVIAGWVVAECGRQPWVVFGLMKISDSLSPVLSETVLSSLIGFIIVYALLMFTFLFYIRQLIANGPEVVDIKEEWLEVVSHTSHVTE